MSLQGRIQDFKLGGRGALNKIAPSGGRREYCWGISCEKSLGSTPALVSLIEGTREGKKRQIQKCKYPAAERKNDNFWGKYPGGTIIIANSPWLLDNREICF